MIRILCVGVAVALTFGLPNGRVALAQSRNDVELALLPDDGPSTRADTRTIARLPIARCRVDGADGPEVVVLADVTVGTDGKVIGVEHSDPSTIEGGSVFARCVADLFTTRTRFTRGAARVVHLVARLHGAADAVPLASLSREAATALASTAGTSRARRRITDAVPELRIGAVRLVRGTGVSIDLVRRRLAQYSARFRYCAERGLTDGPGFVLPGEHRFAIVVTEDGRMNEVASERRSDASVFGNCVGAGLHSIATVSNESGEPAVVEVVFAIRLVPPPPPRRIPRGGGGGYGR